MSALHATSPASDDPGAAPDGRAVGPEPIIVGAEIAAGHDGVAELVVYLRHENGVVAPTILGADEAFALMRACKTESLSGLIGRSWREIIKEL